MGARSPLGIAAEAVSCSIIFMIAGVAEPPNLALNFTPFQFQGLWLDVITTPPADPVVFTAYETAGVGVASRESFTGIPALARTSAATRAKLGEPKRVS
jgi:hypothetical protein